jgi:hypothetical protein
VTRLRVGLVLLAVAALGAGCALNQRLVIARAPYGVSDLVFAADRQLEIKPCDNGGQVWAQLPVMFVAGRPITEMAYRLEEQSAQGGEFREVSFPYELRLLTKPEDADQKLTAAWRGRPAGVSPSVQQEMQQQMIRRATDVKRTVRRRDEWRCEVTAGSRLVTFEGNRLLGKHMFALVAPASGFHTGGHYRLTFSVPFAAPSTPSTHVPPDEMTRLGAGGESGVPTPEDVIGRIELTMIKNSNLIGVPVGIGLIIGFLILTTL